MANKNPLGEGKLMAMPQLAMGEAAKERLVFDKAVYELGLKLIEDYRAGKCADRNKTLEAIIEIFKVSQRPFFSGGTINEFGI